MFWFFYWLKVYTICLKFEPFKLKVYKPLSIVSDRSSCAEKFLFEVYETRLSIFELLPGE